MYIEDRLFSETSEEALYSVLMDETEYALYSEFIEEALYSKKHGHHRDSDVDLDEADSWRGIGRASALGAFGGPVGIAAANYGRHKGYKAARKADKEGASEVATRDIATEEGALAGAKAGAIGNGALAGLGAGAITGVAAKKVYDKFKKKDNHKILRFLNKSAKKHNSKLKGSLALTVGVPTALATLGGAALGAATGGAGGAAGAHKKTSSSLEYRHRISDSAKKGRYRD